jgi:hypothetical protein
MAILERQISVNSSVIDDFDYNTIARALQVVFRTGGVYEYANVPPTVYLEFLNADSKGTYFNTNIRNRYGFVRLL